MCEDFYFKSKIWIFAEFSTSWFSTSFTQDGKLNKDFSLHIGPILFIEANVQEPVGFTKCLFTPLTFDLNHDLNLDFQGQILK